MSAIAAALDRLGKLVPAIGLVVNRARFPGLHCGMMVEIARAGSLACGEGVRIGALTRIECGGAGRIMLGAGVGLGRDVHILTETSIEIGEGCGVNDRARIYGTVAIGRNCTIGANLNVSSGSHAFRSPEPWLPIPVQDARYPEPDAPVAIHDDCFIGINVVIMAGVTVGRGAVIGANAVVTRDVAPYAVVAGSPARRIGQRLEFAPPAAIFADRPEHTPYFYSGFDREDRPGGGWRCRPKVAFCIDAGRVGGITVEINAFTAGMLTLAGDARSFEAGRSSVTLKTAAASKEPLAMEVRGDCAIASIKAID